MAAKKDLAMLPSPAFTPCASEGCRYPGRLWVRTLPPSQRFCVNHYYRAIDEDGSLRSDDVVPPKMMADVVAKPVAGE